MAAATCDVLILGGGPAGSTAAILLAEAGVAVTVVEAERFPRFHIGESLLPHSLPLLDRLGVHDQVRALPRTIRKEGASFTTHDGARHAIYWFDQALPPAIPNAYQVRRDEFDAVLLDRARLLGVRVLEGRRATNTIWDGNRLAGLTVRSEDGLESEMRAKVVIDASGQTAFIANRMGWRFSYPRHRKVAVFGHFKGVWRPEGREAGNINITLTNGGWCWSIPFADGSTSVGAVLDVRRWKSRGGGADEVLATVVEETPELRRRMVGAATLVAPTVTQNFSYRVLHRAGDGYCLVGDAAGFLDPIFSTGVFIATATAASAAQDIVDALASHGRLDANDFAPTVVLTRSLHRLFFAFIRAYYDPHFLAFFFSPREFARIPAAIVSLLAADVLRPGRFLRVARFHLLRTLARTQGLMERWGVTLVPPLEVTPTLRPTHEHSGPGAPPASSGPAAGDAAEEP
jgi:flavin-dependent dehydrogenase